MREGWVVRRRGWFESNSKQFPLERTVSICITTTTTTTTTRLTNKQARDNVNACARCVLAQPEAGKDDTLVRTLLYKHFCCLSVAAAE